MLLEGMGMFRAQMVETVSQAYTYLLPSSRRQKIGTAFYMTVTPQ